MGVMEMDAIESAEVVFTGVRFDVRALQLPGRDGQSHRREVVVHPGAVVILPILDADRIVLIENERPAVGRVLLELPAGTLEPGEDPLVCAGRELEEETGYRAARVDPLNTFFTSPGICTERMWCYVARDLTFVGQQLDESERIRPRIVPWRDALEMVRTGEIQDGKTIATLLFRHAYGREE